MGDTANTDKVRKKSFYQGLKAEFAKIVWPDRETVTRQTISVVSISIALGAVIAILDFLIRIVLKLILG